MEKIILNQALFNKLILQKELQCVVCVFTKWSGRAHIMRKMLSNIAESKPRNISFFGIDADLDPVLSQRMGIQTVPTLLFFSKGELIEEVQGLISERSMLGIIQSSFNVEAA